MSSRLRITEIFYSLQGESRSVGMPTVFIRLTGCPLRCHYCDTAYAFKGGEWMNIDDILTTVGDFGAHYVTVTGGEPLAQKDCHSLLIALADQGYSVSLETSGAIDITPVDQRIVTVMDIKTPDSGEVEKNLWSNIEKLKPEDQVKFVICSPEDYRWSKQILLEYQLEQRCEVLFSPVFGKIEAADLAQWILNDRLPVRFQIQLHKYLWGEKPGT